MESGPERRNGGQAGGLKSMKILALDPAINRLGWATVEFQAVPAIEAPVFDAQGVATLQLTKPKWDETTTKWAWGFFDLTCLHYIGRLKEVVENLVMEIPAGFDLFVAEWPTFYDNSRGHQAAMRGDTINLAGVCTYVAGYYRLQPWQIALLTATQWKGSVAKEVTQVRFYRTFGINRAFGVDHNAVDACMLLLTYCQRLKLVPKDFIDTPKFIDHEAMPTYQPPRGQPSQRFSRKY